MARAIDALPGGNQVRICLLSIVTVALLVCPAAAQSQPVRGLPQAIPEVVGLLGGELKKIDAAAGAAIQAGEMPGCVVLVARKGRIVYLKAFGQRAVEPAPEPMTTDTIFDMASLTKVIATASSAMVLVERGELRLEDRVRRYLPKFIGGGKDSITVRQLLTHFSGLRPDFDLSKNWFGTDAALEELWAETTQNDPGKEFVYSDLNFITLGEIIRTLVKKPLDQFAREAVFEPLGMNETAFNPPPEWKARIAPTESRSRSLAYLKGEGSETPPQVLRGEVHDPTAWRMDGVAGHAGLFSTARDVSVYAQTLLNRGTYQGRRIFSPLGVLAMTTPQSPRGALLLRGLGWDIDTSYSSPRGDLLGAGYGHTGFTGTSLWIHPPSETFIVILSNRVHPDGKGDATRLRGIVANIVASSIGDAR
jgi:CubicO group peptidase (beta-lactamase class C family)